MAKKHKGVGRTAKKGAKKALKTVKRHGPLTAALVAIGGVASSVLASEAFREAVQDLAGAIMKRAANALNQVTTTTSDALARAADSAAEQGDGEEVHA